MMSDAKTLIGLDGRELSTNKDERRREMKAGSTKQTPYGEVKFMIIVDMPRQVSEDDFKKYMREYAHILGEAFNVQ